jgi:hypothetical protein
MAGNVGEWVMDVYRPMTYYDAEDFRPFRGNVFMKDSLDEEGYHVDKDSLGRIVKVPVSKSESANRLNYRRSDNISFLDGDSLSEVNYNYTVSSLSMIKQGCTKVAPGLTGILPVTRYEKIFG